MGTHHPGPEYLRADEWRAIDRRRRSRRARWWVGTTLVAVVGVFSVWRVPDLVSSARLENTARAIQAAKQIAVVAYPFNDQHVKQPMIWGNWVAGVRERQSLPYRRGVERRGSEMFLLDEAGSGSIAGFDTASIDGRTWLHWLLTEAMEDGLHRVPPATGRGERAEYEAVRGAEKVRFWIDERNGRFVECVVSHLGPQGWMPVANFEAEIDAAFVSMMDSVDRKNVRTLPELGDVEARLPLGGDSAIHVGPVHRSERGTVFVVVRTGQTQVQPYVTDDLGTVYFPTGVRRRWPELPAVEYMFVPLAPMGPERRTISVHFPSRAPGGNEALPPRDLAVYERVFEKPNCRVAPAYRFDYSASEFDTRIDEAVTRGDHLREATRFADGELVDHAGGQTPRRGSELPTVRGDDRRQAIAAYRDALAWAILSGRRAKWTRATLWFRLFDLESQFGDPMIAEKCLETAYATRGREGYEVDGALIEQAYRQLDR